MKKRMLIIGILLAGICTTAIAQDKVVVIPLNSSKVAGTDGQVQYNDGGKNAGAEVYYDKTTGDVGVGTTTPSSKLEVMGEIRTTDSNGNNRFWGEGRPNVGITESTWNQTPSHPNIEYAYSDVISNWYDTPTSCPINTWVCSMNDLEGGTLVNLPSFNRYNCDGTVNSFYTHDAWTADHSTNLSAHGVARYKSGATATLKCSVQKVWCCRETVIP